MANVVVMSEAPRLAGTAGPRLPVLPLDRRLPAAYVPQQPAAVTDAMLDVLNHACGSGVCGDTDLASVPGGIPAAIPGEIHIPGGHACAQAPAAFGGLDAIQPKGPKATNAAADGPERAAAEAPAEEGAEAKKTAAPACAIADAEIPAGDDRTELHALGGPSTSLGTQVFDMYRSERSHERQTVLTQSSHECAATLMDSDTLRFTYHFRSWQGQPGVVVSLNLHEQGCKLRVEAPDRAVFTALLANRDALPGVLKIADNEPGSSRREGRQREPGE